MRALLFSFLSFIILCFAGIQLGYIHPRNIQKTGFREGARGTPFDSKVIPRK